MARHDREESLEEQLAWLDAIKETDEAPVSVGAPTAAADEPVSPYPKDPWSLVPAQPDTPTPPLFRAAVQSATAPAPAAPAEPDDEWLGEAATTDITREALRELHRDEPPAVVDPFHAPLKPLPRPDDTDGYGPTFTPAAEPPQPSQAAQEPEADERADATWPPADWSRPSEPGGWPRPPAEEPWAEERQAEERQREERQHEERRAEERRAENKRAENKRAEDKQAEDQWAEEPAAAEPAPEPESWAETLPRTERPQWPDLSADLSPDLSPGLSTDRPTGPSTGPFTTGPAGDEAAAHPASETAPATGRRPGTEPGTEPGIEPEPVHDEPEPAPFKAEPKAPPRVEPIQKQPRPQWTEQQEWRPAERDIPPIARRSPAPVPVFNAPPRPPVTGRPTADSLDPDTLLRGRRNAPSKGWRRLVYKASGGWIKPGEPPEVRRRRELMTRARTPVTAGHHRVAVLSLKGGVGKTTTTVGLGATLAQVRGDRVIAVDANPDRGTLSDKLVLETSATVRDLLNERDQVKRYVDIRAFTSQAPSRLEVLASDRDPSVSEAFSGADYQAVSQVLESFYSICITDCGTGLLHSAMGGVLGLADQIVLVSSPSVDGARAASATLDWLEAHHYGDLVKNATVVLCSVRPRSKSAVDISKLEAHFAARCRAVVQVPYDPHLEEGAEIDLDRLQDATREAYLKLAAHVGDGFTGAP
ncbi:AAA family ATPase [Nonomuraea sp. NPDC050783]|uniref:MinD/ParA family ATP-binding protein n=1 Tax=Nonomuraea sp. NPDC050783 TaxID=3154634 RepID=UPI00346579DF